MNKKENLYYALGHLAYTVAIADGAVQKEERQIIHDIVTEEVKRKVNPEFNISEIIFSILQKQEVDAAVTYGRAIKELDVSRDLLSDELKQLFLDILYKVAAAFPPVEKAEEAVINKFVHYLEAK